LGDVLSRYEGLKQPDGTEIATSTLERSLNLAPLDFHLARSFFYLARIYRYQAKWDEEIFFLDKAKAFFEQRGDGYGLAYVHIERKRGLARRGLWRDLFATQERLDDLCRCLPESAALESETLGSWAWCWALAGRLSASEQRLKASIDLSRSLDDPVSLYWVLPHLGWALGYQGRYLDAERCFSEYLEIANNLAEKGHDQEDRTFNIGYGKGFWGVVLTRQGRTDKAAECLSQSLSIGMELGDPLWMLESLTWLGRLSEVKQNLDEAQDYFDRCSNWKWYRQHFFYSESLTGLVRVKHVQGDYAAIPPLLAEAEQLAQQYEYNDHLASLRLSQGHIAWNGHIPEWGNGFEAALYFYQQALIYALRYNRFLLDEVLWGGNVCTPLRPIIPHCLERGEEGRKVLTVLRDWWKTGVNDIGTPRPDTISPIPEGIPLLEAERIAREREPGDGAPQKSVVEQIEAVLGPVTSRENDHE
jgi:tetratricopeptide (TPR) repeat protein